MQKKQETWVRSLGREDSLEEEMATHFLQYSCLENPMDRGAWWATYTPWGHKASDMTEQPSTHESLTPISLGSGIDTLVLPCPVSATMGS